MKKIPASSEHETQPSVESPQNQQVDTHIAALQNTIHQLRTILNQTGVYIFTKDTAGRYTYVNQKVQELFGVAIDDIIGKDDSHFFDLERAAEFRHNDCLVIEQGETIAREENIVIKATGETRIYWAIKSPIRNNDGQIIGLSGISTDITAIKQTQEELRLSKEQLEVALANMSDAVFISDAEGRFIEFNDAFATFHKFSNKDECAKKLSDYPEFLEVYSSSGELLPLEQWAVPRALRGESATNVEFTLRLKDTGETWVGSYNYAPIRNEQGVIVGSVTTGREITERKKLEEVLVAREKEFRLLAEAMPQIVWITRADGWNIYFNQQWVDYTGLTLEESYGHGWNKPFHPDDQQRAWDTWQNAVHNNDIYSLECQLRRADGKYRWWLIRGVPVFDDTGKIDKWFGTCTDIHNIKQIEQELQASEQRMKCALEQSRTGWWSLDLVNHTAHRNLVHDRIFGYSSLLPHWSYEMFLDHVLPEDRHEVDRLFNEAISTGNGWTFDCRIRRTDGEIRWIWAIGDLQYDENNQVQYMTGIVQDITERKQGEDQIRIAATAFESQEGMVVTDADANILRVNRAFSTITSYSAEEAIGQNPRILNSRQHDKAFYTAMWEHIKSEGAWEGEIWNRHKNGEAYPEWLSITAVKNMQGEITNYVGNFRDIGKLKENENKIKQLAYYDPLTLLANRSLLYDRLKQAFAISARSHRHGALLFIDLDNFKTLNDTLGHDVGDLLLQQVAERLQLCVREGDTVARLGGDEFVIILENLSDTAIEAVAQSEVVGKKILSSFNALYTLGKHSYRGTPSIGFSLFKGHDTSMDNLLKQADIAMYQAKMAGRNTLRFFDQNMQDIVTRRAALESDLREAIQNNQFVLYYQSQVDGTGYITGAEVLIRWIHPLRGMVSPVEFIPLAEETGLILPIGQWVLETACLQLVAWEKSHATRRLQLAVNVSIHQFQQPDFVRKTLETLARIGVNPSRLKLELTESLLAKDVENIIDKMTALKAHGISFSLDDFGTGYSSLSYLKRLPLSQLKIDQSFVRDVLTDPNDAAIARTVVALAQSMGLSVIAEGVETQGQRDFLAIHGCNYFQGYLFSKPIPIEQFEAILGRVD